MYPHCSSVVALVVRRVTQPKYACQLLTKTILFDTSKFDSRSNNVFATAFDVALVDIALFDIALIDVTLADIVLFDIALIDIALFDVALARLKVAVLDVAVFDVSEAFCARFP